MKLWDKIKVENILSKVNSGNDLSLQLVTTKRELRRENHARQKNSN